MPAVKEDVGKSQCKVDVQGKTAKVCTKLNNSASSNRRAKEENTPCLEAPWNFKNSIEKFSKENRGLTLSLFVLVGG